MRERETGDFRRRDIRYFCSVFKYFIFIVYKYHSCLQTYTQSFKREISRMREEKEIMKKRVQETRRK